MIDIGSTHSYVSSTIFVNLGIFAECTTREVFVISHLGQSVEVNKVYKRDLLEIQGVVFSANLTKLPFGKYNLILGMD